MKKTLRNLSLLLLPAVASAQVGGLDWTTSPVEHSRGPLTQRQGVYTRYAIGQPPQAGEGGLTIDPPLGPVAESPNLRFASESYPRVPADFVGAPSVETKEGITTVRFTLDRPDDVTVRVVDAEGKTLRVLASGVVGLEQAAEPYAAASLSQTVVWDGKDRNGNAMPADAKIQVCLGLSPTFEKFIGYNPGQPTAYINNLQVDPKGNVYVGLATQNRVDPILLRFDAEGAYRDMVYPSNPEMLERTGKKIADVYEHVEVVEGKEVPILQSLWRTHIHRFEGFMKLPFVISQWGHAYMVEGMQKYTHPPKYPEVLAHVFDVDLENFWFKPWNADGEFGSSFTIPGQYKDVAVDKDGNVYLLMSRLAHIHNSVWLQDGNQFGTVTKIDPETWQGVPSFTHNGTKELEEPSPYLGTPGAFRQIMGFKSSKLGMEFEEVYHRYFVLGEERSEPYWEEDSDSFLLEPEEIAVDDQGRLLIIDGLPRRLKMYAANGSWLGERDHLTVGGKERILFDVISVECGNDAHYLLTSFKDLKDKAYLLKVKDLVDDPTVIWAVELDELSRFIAIDANRSPAQIWVANGDGRATFSRIKDSGEKVTALDHFGGFQDGVLSDPWQVDLTEDGKVFVYDYDRHAIVATDLDNQSWKVTDADPPSVGLEYNARFRRWGYGYDTPLRGSETMVRSIFADEEYGRLWVTYDGGKTDPGEGYLGENLSRGYDIFDLNLELLDMEIEAVPNVPNTMFQSSIKWPFIGVVNWTDAYDGVLFEAQIEAGRWMYQTKKRGSESVVVPNRARSLKDGSFVDAPIIKTQMGTGNMVADSRGNIYTLDISPMENLSRVDVLFGFPNHHMYWAGFNGTPDTYHFFRGDEPVTHQSEIIELVKFGPEGGVRIHDEEWAFRGAGFFNNFCGNCSYHGKMLAVTADDHIVAGDPIYHAVKFLDPAGNLVQWVGQYGNAETHPEPGGSAKELGFHNVFTVAAAGDDVLVTDRDLKRLAHLKMTYRKIVSLEKN